MSPLEQIEALITDGRYLEGCQLAKEQLRSTDDLRLKQLYALALAKSGMPEVARDFLEPVYRSGGDDPETAGIMGSIYKELFKKNQESSFALRARDTYLNNYKSTSDYYTGINAASMSAMLMQSSKSKEIARHLISRLKDTANTFWEIATLAEAFLLAHEEQQALDAYAQARKMAGSEWGRVMSVHRQLWMLNHYVRVPNELMKMFEPPRVAAFVGHMIDHPDRSTPRFPPSIEPEVSAAIRQNIDRLRLQVGYCALACGSDILFAEAMLQHGGAVNILLPFDVPDFVEQSVRFAGEHWVERFQRLLQKFPVTFVSRARYEGDDSLFSLQGKAILGSAVLQSRSFQSEPVLLSVLSQADLRIREGGTRNMINSWPFPNTHTNIGIESFGTGLMATRAITEKKEGKKSTSGVIQYLVSVDASRLNVLERAKLWTGLEEKINEAPIHGRRLKDGDHWSILSFDTESEAIEIHKALHRLASSRLGLVLHVGPVQRSGDEVSGATVDELKRMRAWALPGHTIASRTFAALLALLPAEFQVEYASTATNQNGEDLTVYNVTVA